MKVLTALVAASIVGGWALAAQSPAGAPAASRETRELLDVLPAGTKAGQFVLTADGQRTFFVNDAGEAWLYDRTKKTNARVAAGPLWDLSVSPKSDVLAYTKGGDRRGDQFVWSLALDPATGLARGSEQRLSTNQGDVPSISPDAKLVAFARDDPSGVGQSAVVVPTGGGAEKVVAAGVPSSVANIRWTPDGKTLYISVNSPVACQPEWSCLPLATQDLRQPPGSIRRVSVSGGAVTIVAPARSPLPGLSPDGTTLMFLEAGAASPPGAPRRWVVTGADGAPRDTVTLPATQSPIGWLSGSTVLISSTERNQPTKVLTMDVSAGRVR